jgi:beta-N-acetylhexosaminidase
MSPAIGRLNRSFSNDPMTVFSHASWFKDEFAQKNVISSLKHYPGHGSAIDDSHLGFTDITNTWSDSELIPYEQLIADGYSDFIMTGHLYNANIDSLYPASLSYKTITTLLKDSLGFNGLVISDEMFMGAIVSNYTFEEAIELAINAGTDILLYRTNERNNLSLVRQFIDIVEQKVNMGVITQNRIDESYQKIINIKQQFTSIEFSSASSRLPSKITIRNYPNPFNSGTTIEFETQRNGTFDIKIFNVLGQVVPTSTNTNNSTTGKYSLYFDASHLASGIYFVQAKINQSLVMKKITCLK